MIAPVLLAKMCRPADALALLAMYGIRTFPSIRAVDDDSIPPFRRLFADFRPALRFAHSPGLWPSLRADVIKGYAPPVR